VPALPLDGGRAAHAALWVLTGQEATGARLVAVAGRGLGGALLVLAVMASASGDAALAIWLGLLGLTIYMGAPTSPPFPLPLGSGPGDPARSSLAR
jgi:Zn-dependent protease